jgi:hypothetical protein
MAVLDCKELAAEIAPRLVAELVANEERLVQAAGGLLQRGALRMFFPVILREVPNMTEMVVTLTAERFGTITLEEIAASLVQIKATGRTTLGDG